MQQRLLKHKTLDKVVAQASKVELVKDMASLSRHKSMTQVQLHTSEEKDRSCQSDESSTTKNIPTAIQQLQKDVNKLKAAEQEQPWAVIYLEEKEDEHLRK
ncbi:Hypothetical predicted protein [Podarcis lilfordi]|uniref:Uncharacterized protein n=1 Tax=Podarcis lilfordi TaxID=74358 RepID=A0AA35K8B3_9SAUR|nr:Hypothetical predicted protein [Podarcis lilfordi]